MSIFGKDKEKSTTKPVQPTQPKLIKQEMYCCQCHRKISECYVTPEKEDSYKDIFQMCPGCFIEISLYMAKKKKEEEIPKPKKEKKKKKEDSEQCSWE